MDVQDLVAVIVFINNPSVSTLRDKPVSSSERDSTHRVVRSGVKITAIRVDTVVKLTERATLVFAIKQTTLEAVPPGQQATRTSPIIKSIGKWKTRASKYPKKGMTVYCSPTPIKIDFGILSTRAKSSKLRVKPMQSIIIARKYGIQVG